ncbi:S1 family peptidase [Methylobacterium nonmethylotrophicum]|uniref:S1 family peptidase n=1 Tax=Methylobacterium nonmethylotrophicum TaxID=1141884 RepID=A0A4Z0NQD4_9HYPH|nr:S1 family peptidase [Methylobacterium nonmethylotrophicum]TGD98401.1 S1 family peptidase [Methylobacterium nonmethylotrophicum]
MTRPTLPLLAALILLAGPARAVVGGSEAPDAALARSSVMVLSSRGGVCTGIVLARDVVLTAAHCAAGGAEHRVHFRDGSGAPVLVGLAARVVHPGYDAGAIAGRRRSIDLALLRTEAPLPDRFVPAALTEAPAAAGTPLTLGGYGVARPGDHRSTGTFRTVTLPVVEPYGPSRILVWLKGPAASGACEGDSGGPIAAGDRPNVLAVATWASGAGGGACGGFSQGVLVGPQRAWITRVTAGWGAEARWE